MYMLENKETMSGGISGVELIAFFGSVCADVALRSWILEFLGPVCSVGCHSLSLCALVSSLTHALAQ